MSEPGRPAGQREPTAAVANARRPRRLVLLALVGVAVLIAFGVLARPLWSTRDNRPRNVLLFTLDTTRADYLGCYGRATAQTPNLDRLAREGTLFARCASASPLTLPSHSSILTGEYPYAHGARQNGTGRLAAGAVTLAEALKQAGFTTQATVAAFVLNRQFGTDQGFDVYNDVVPAAVGNPLNAERKGDEIARDAVELLQSVKDRPFFLWVHFYDPHFPYESPRIPDQRSPNAYADEIAFMDTQIGVVLDQLRALGHEQDTLVIAVGDHGEGLGQHDELMHGYLLYDTTIHVPFLVRGPGVPAGRTVTAQVRTIDIAPTILAALKLPAMERAQGVSLWPLLAPTPADLQLTGYSETFDAQIEYGLSQLRSLSAGQWKYILAPQSELYDIAIDPGELRNVLSANTARGEQLRTALHDLLADAPPPPSAEESAVKLTGDEAARLAGLGYVGTPSAFTEEDVTELDRFEPRGGDPKDYIHYFRLLVDDLPRMQANKEYAQAEQLLRRLIDAMPDASRLYVHLAAALNPQGRTDEATQAFERAVALAPHDYDIRRKYGTFLGRVQRYADAIAQFELVLQQLPTDTFTLEESARAHAALGQFTAAEQQLTAGLAVEPRSVRLLRAFGRIKEMQGQPAAAADYYRQALAIDPDLKDCQADLARIEQARPN